LQWGRSNAKIVDRLDNSQNPAELIAAVEVGFIALKLSSFLDDLIDGNSARRDCRDRTATIAGYMVNLCRSDAVRAHFVDSFQRNAQLIQQNQAICSELLNTLGTVDQAELDKHTKALEALLGEKFKMLFEYDGIIDPDELQQVITTIQHTIERERTNITSIQEFMVATNDVATNAVEIQAKADELYLTMKGNVEAMAAELIGPTHFACELLDQVVIEEFYSKDLRPAVSELRSHLVNSVSVDTVVLLTTGTDLHSLSKGGDAITKADLLRFQAHRDKVDQHIKSIRGIIKTAEEDIKNAELVPQKNADGMRSELSTAYVVTCIPLIGLIMAAEIMVKIKRFEAAFSSTVGVYRELGAYVVGKNATMVKVMYILAGIIGIGGLGFFLGAGVSPNLAVNIGVPLSVAGSYGISGLILSSAGKRLQSYLAHSEPQAG